MQNTIERFLNPSIEPETFVDEGEAHWARPVALVLRDEDAIGICDALLDLTAELFSIPSHYLRSRSRGNSDIAQARQIAMYVGHVALGMTITSVGLGFQRDKSTVLHACRKVEDMRDDPAFDFVVGRMERLARIMARTSPVMKGN